MTIPFWVYFVSVGILISAYMAVKTGREDRKLERDIIEREGEVYMKRLDEEKELRNNKVKSEGI